MLTVSTPADSERPRPTPDWDDVESVTAWARPVLIRGREAAGGALPRFGSDEWLDLPVGHPARWAAVVAAALMTLLDGQPGAIAERLRREMDDQDRAVLQRVKDAACDVSDGTNWTARANEPTHAELQRRRAL